MDLNALNGSSDVRISTLRLTLNSVAAPSVGIYEFKKTRMEFEGFIVQMVKSWTYSL